MAEVIKVTLPDGKEICYKSPLHTFIEVLKWIGAQRFDEIPVKINGRPLVSHETYPIKNYTIEILPGWHFIKQADTRERYLKLLAINNGMNLGMKIEIGDFKGEKNPPIQGVCRPKSLLRVTMPDGELVDYDSYRDVFMTVIDKLGPRTISAKANFDWSANQPLLSVTNPDGVRIKVADSLFLALPYTVKKAANMLNLIAKRLGIAENIKIEVIPAVEQI